MKELLITKEGKEIMGTLKYTFDDVQNEFGKRDYILLSTSDEFHGASSKMRYVCKKHSNKGEQQIDLSHLKNGKGCYYCGRERTENAHRIYLDKETDKELCKKNNFEYIDTIRKNGKITILFICNNHKELGIQSMTRHNMQRDIHGCKYCSGKGLPEWYVLKKAYEANPNIKLIDPYVNLTTRMKCYCEKHHTYTNKTMQAILRGQGCYYCGKEKMLGQGFLSLEEYQDKVTNVTDTIEVLEYNGAHSYAKFRCKICGAEWESNAATMVTTGKQCPKCQKYYLGEKGISSLLDKWGIKYIPQYRFNDCRAQRPLPFDFYLPEDNVCIEFDGEQHFKNRKGWTDLKVIQSHDNIKNNYCRKNNIKLLRIAYWEEDDMEQILFDGLVKCNVLEDITDKM